MKQEFWHERWKNQQIGFHQSDINPYLLAYFNHLKLPEGGAVFVPLSGKSTDLIWLAEQGYHVFAVELSQLAIEQFFLENKLNYETSDVDQLKCYKSGLITVYQGDFFDLKAEDLGTVDAVFDRASMVALPEEMRSRYCEQLMTLTAKAKILLVSMEYDQQKMSGPPFSVKTNEIERYYVPHYQITLLDNVDLLQSAPQFKERGLDSLNEKVYQLIPFKQVD